MLNTQNNNESNFSVCVYYTKMNIVQWASTITDDVLLA